MKSTSQVEKLILQFMERVAVTDLINLWDRFVIFIVDKLIVIFNS